MGVGAAKERGRQTSFKSKVGHGLDVRVAHFVHLKVGMVQPSPGLLEDCIGGGGLPPNACPGPLLHYSHPPPAWTLVWVSVTQQSGSQGALGSLAQRR
jgi:hypothetical protein